MKGSFSCKYIPPRKLETIVEEVPSFVQQAQSLLAPPVHISHAKGFITLILIMENGNKRLQKDAFSRLRAWTRGSSQMKSRSGNSIDLDSHISVEKAKTGSIQSHSSNNSLMRARDYQYFCSRVKVLEQALKKLREPEQYGSERNVIGFYDFHEHEDFLWKRLELIEHIASKLEKEYQTMHHQNYQTERQVRFEEKPRQVPPRPPLRNHQRENQRTSSSRNKVNIYYSSPDIKDNLIHKPEVKFKFLSPSHEKDISDSTTAHQIENRTPLSPKYERRQSQRIKVTSKLPYGRKL